jgi:hypothetical protein
MGEAKRRGPKAERIETAEVRAAYIEELKRIISDTDEPEEDRRMAQRQLFGLMNA